MSTLWVAWEATGVAGNMRKSSQEYSKNMRAIILVNVTQADTRRLLFLWGIQLGDMSLR